MLRVFVYGTLKPGEAFYDRYCADYVTDQQEAIAFGQLFDLPLGYPAMTPGTQPVYGVLLAFTDPTVLDALDELEDYHPDRPAHDNEYQRQELEIFSLDHYPLGLAWVYVMTVEQAQRLGGTVVGSGRWVGQSGRRL